MASIPGVANRQFGFPIRTKIDTHKVGLRWKWGLSDHYGNRIAQGDGGLTKAQAFLSAMKFRNAEHARRMKDGV